MSYRERSIYSHRTVSSKIGLLDPIPGDGRPLRAKQKSATRQEPGTKATKTETKEHKRTPTQPGTREKRTGTGLKTRTKNKDQKSDGRRPVTAVDMQRKRNQARKPEVLESAKKLRSKNASKSSIQLKREALEQPELHEVYAPEEADVLPSLSTARVNPYQKYQELIDELNRKYEHEQSLEKIYHRHIEFSVDMGQDARRRPYRAKGLGALARSVAVTTSTMDLGVGTPSGRGSIVEMRHGEDDDQAERSALELGEASMSLCSDATGGCDSSDSRSDTKAVYETSSTLGQGRRFEGSGLGDATSDECGTSARRSLTSGGGDELDTPADGTVSSTRSWHADCLTPTLSCSREVDVDELDTDRAPSGDHVGGRDKFATRDAVSAIGEGDDVDLMGDGGDEEDAAASGGSSLAGSEEAEETDDSDRGEYCLAEDDFVDDRDDDRDDGSDEQVSVDVRDRQDAVSVRTEASGDDVDDGEEAAVEDAEETEDRLERASMEQASSECSSSERHDAKSTTSLPSSVLTSKWRAAGVAAVNASAVAVGVGAATAETKSMVAVGEGGRLPTMVDGDLEATFEEAQRQIAALQRQVASMRTNRIEAARRRVRAATWLRHLSHVESRLRAEQLELADLWRHLQPLEQIARHWPDHGGQDRSDVWPVVYPPVAAACGDAGEI